jgi:hypothetical protein
MLEAGGPSITRVVRMGTPTTGEGVPTGILHASPLGLNRNALVKSQRSKVKSSRDSILTFDF